MKLCYCAFGNLHGLDWPRTIMFFCLRSMWIANAITFTLVSFNVVTMGPWPPPEVVCLTGSQSVLNASGVHLHLYFHAVKHYPIDFWSSKMHFNARCKEGNNLSLVQRVLNINKYRRKQNKTKETKQLPLGSLSIYKAVGAWCWYDVYWQSMKLIIVCVGLLLYVRPYIIWTVFSTVWHGETNKNSKRIWHILYVRRCILTGKILTSARCKTTWRSRVWIS